MKLRNNILEKEKLRRERMTERELRNEELKDEIKTVLFNKNKVEKICNMSLAMLLLVVVSTIMLLLFQVINFNFSKVPKVLIIMIPIIFLIFIVRLVQFKNRDIVLNKFLDEMENKSDI